MRGFAMPKPIEQSVKPMCRPELHVVGMTAVGPDPGVGANQRVRCD